MKEYFHSVNLDKDKCRGCTNCIKRCPTEAIRVRKSKAQIINERCIDCGECIRVCPYHAKTAITDKLDIINNFKFKVALPAPSLYGQFDKKYTRDNILYALKSLGFDYVYEVAKGAEIVSEATRQLLKNPDIKKPMISSACPGVVRLIQVRFPGLIENIVKLESPMEVAAKSAKNELHEKHSIALEDIGVFFISPCAAKVTSVKAPYEKQKSNVDGVISINDIYLKLLSALNNSEKGTNLAEAGIEGINWANSGGESSALGTEKVLAVDGIHNVIKIFDEIEEDRLKDIDFVEALSCTGGCLGGPLTVANAFVARTTQQKHMSEASEKYASDIDNKNYKELVWTSDVEYKPVMKLDQNVSRAIEKLEMLERLYAELPGLDCGACGSPNCRALAEDIVRGIANETDCIFKLRERIRDLAEEMVELGGKMPPVMDKDK
ncbi:iron only hydrogenase large subunit-like protein [Ruminiclostridium sufflavum DSM 19573]|uniref:Iron only hydrogenase large subunit-like protein n=1 Tax=Ruminiclostridium sufflavum DSM 19573 TaxID=1121337 RepID=A0A318XP31_9FIRM|nr:[Fe-Fe] hydrogenase large subunit C-terminal domain-containing protein [Ruminiclostridium sufflavum]PYG88795.1 iron only hydrogenase large subunit-like protein [Ruminiclostridium sufflavum DSM 19573]